MIKEFRSVCQKVKRPIFQNRKRCNKMKTKKISGAEPKFFLWTTSICLKIVFYIKFHDNIFNDGKYKKMYNRINDPIARDQLILC